MSGTSKPAPRPRVFDSWAVVAFLEDEPPAAEIEEIIVTASEIGAPLLISAANMGEVWYSIARSASEAEADAAILKLVGLGFMIVAIDWELTRQAAFYKAFFRLAYADCFAAALAKQRETSLLTGDREFERLEKEIKVHWLNH